MPGPPERLQALISALDAEDTITAEEAQCEITNSFREEALEPLLEAAPASSGSGCPLPD